MTSGWSSDLSTAAAYQEVTLAELRGLYDQLDFDLQDLLERELEIEGEVTGLADALDALSTELEASGMTVSRQAVPSPDRDEGVLDPTLRPSRYSVPLVPATDDFGQIVALANGRLEQLRVDLKKDPLLQVLPASQVSQSIQQYADEYGETDWNKQDWSVVLAAGFIASLLDILLVRIPRDETFLGRDQAGSPLTKWLQDKERSERIHKRFFKRFEKAKTPYDGTHSSPARRYVSGLHPEWHRVQSFGHDPLLGLIIGVADLMRATGTYVDMKGKIWQVPWAMDPVGLTTAVLTQVQHILSDFHTTMGVPPPLFTLLQVGQVGSPFALGSSGVKVPWTDVSRYMYRHGYDLRHFFVSGIVPATVTAIIMGYWLLDGLARRGMDADRTRDRAKLASMMLVGHTIATSGNLVKTGLLFSMNPLALNWAQLLAMAPVTVAWIAETSGRDARIRRGLDKEWQRLLAESETLARPTTAR